jgi:hypothetical protein
MSVQLRAPFPGVMTICVLPNPELGDSEANTDQVSIRRAMDGTKRTYVKSSLRTKMLLEFRLSREKAFELINFVRSYHSTQMLYVDHLARTWSGYLMNNPVELETYARGVGSTASERVNVTLEFEGIEV